MNKQPKRIAVVGGNGSVGRQVCAILAKELPAGSVLVAGLDIARAKKLADSLGNGAAAIGINAFEPASYRKLFEPELRVAAVISCVELPASSLLPKEMLEHGINYTELSATYELHQRLMKLHSIAKKHGATAVVGVGLMPGLSNVMASDAASKLDEVTAVRINILLGLGEAHGIDAVKWLLRNLGASYDMMYGDGVKRVRGFTDPYKMTLLDETRPRTFYRFNFSDQHMLNKTIPSTHVDSRMAFDSKAITALLGGAGKLRLLSLVKEGIASLFQNITKSAVLGSAVYALQVEASGVKDGRSVTKTVLAKGEVEAKITAEVAAYVCELLLTDKPTTGVHPIERVVKADELYAYVKRKGTDIQNR